MSITHLAPPKAITPDRAIGMTVSQYLAINSLSRADIGQVLGITGQNVSFRLNGKSKWTVENLLALSELFGVTVNDLMPTPDGNGGWTPAPYRAPYVEYAKNPPAEAGGDTYTAWDSNPEPAD